MTSSKTTRTVDSDYVYRRHQQKYNELSSSAQKLLIVFVLFAWLMPQEVLGELSAIEADRARIASARMTAEGEQQAMQVHVKLLNEVRTEFAKVEQEFGTTKWRDRSNLLVAALRALSETVQRFREKPLADLEPRPTLDTRQQEPVRTDDRVPQRAAWEAKLLAAARSKPQPPRDLGEVHRSLAETEVAAFLASTSDWIERSFVKPVEAMLPRLANVQADLPVAAELQHAIPKVREALEAWQARLADDPTWWRTVDEKHQAIQQLQEAVHKAEKLVLGLAKQVHEAGDAKRGVAEAKVLQLTAQQQEREKTAETLAARMKALTPDWLQSVVTVPRMAGMFPYALLFVALLLAWRLQRIRHHFLAIRSRLDPADEFASDPALSSLLTLVWRRGGTFWTAATLLLAIGIGWWGLTSGIAALQPIRPERLKPEWAHAGLSVTAWIAHGLFAGAVVAVLVAVRPPRATPSPAATS